MEEQEKEYFLHLINAKQFEFNGVSLTDYDIQIFCENFQKYDINTTNKNGWNLLMIYLSIDNHLHKKIKLTTEQWENIFQNLNIQHKNKNNINILQFLISSFENYKNYFPKKYIEAIEKKIQLSEEEKNNLIPLYFQNYHKLRLSEKKMELLIEQLNVKQSNKEINDIINLLYRQKIKISENICEKIIKKINFKNVIEKDLLLNLFIKAKPNKKQILYILENIDISALRKIDFAIYSHIYWDKNNLSFSSEEINNIFNRLGNHIEKILITLNKKDEELKEYLLYQRKIDVSQELKNDLKKYNPSLFREIIESYKLRLQNQLVDHPSTIKKAPKI